MSEQIMSVERLSSMVKAGAVENYTPRGLKPGGDQAAIDILYKTEIDRRLGLSGSGWGAPPEGFTRIGLAPIGGFTLPKEKKVVAGFSPNDVAVCVAYHGVNIDSSNRRGTLRAIVIMSEEDAALLVEEVRTNPSLVYALLRHVNEGPIKRYDGNPMDIKPGKEVEILANDKAGGDMDKTTKSKPFNEDFNPNPLL